MLDFATSILRRSTRAGVEKSGNWHRTFLDCGTRLRRAAPERQQMVRLLIEQIVIHDEGESEQARITIQWAGGYTSQHTFKKSLDRYEKRSDYGELCKRIAALREQGLSFAEMAVRLNSEEGFRPLRRTSGFDGGTVSRLLARQIRPESRPEPVEKPGTPVALPNRIELGRVLINERLRIVVLCEFRETGVNRVPVGFADGDFGEQAAPTTAYHEPVTQWASKPFRLAHKTNRRQPRSRKPTAGLLRNSTPLSREVVTSIR